MNNVIQKKLEQFFSIQIVRLKFLNGFTESPLVKRINTTLADKTFLFKLMRKKR